MRQAPLLEGQIRAMQDNSLDGLEIRNVDHVNDSDISDSKAGQVRARLDEAGLRVWSIGSPIGKIDIEKDNFAEHTEKYRRTLEIAHILGAENIRFFRKKIECSGSCGGYRQLLSRRNKKSRLSQGYLRKGTIA